uniref:Uncharacterized protein n=1 Tax=Parascaris univalens TaxID=6257 RepID=A0A915C5J5_PARUN
MMNKGFRREMQFQVEFCLKASLIPLNFFILQLFFWGCFSKGRRFSTTARSAAVNPSDADKKPEGNSEEPSSLKGQTEADIVVDADLASKQTYAVPVSRVDL